MKSIYRRKIMIKKLQRRAQNLSYFDNKLAKHVPRLSGYILTRQSYDLGSRTLREGGNP